MDWLNSNSGAITGIATVVLVVITGYYVYLTWRLLKASHTPEIAIFLRPHEVHIKCLMLCIENVGTGPARGLRFQTDFSFKPDGKTPLEEISFLKNGITYFGRGQKIEHFLVSVVEKLDDLKRSPLEITVTYRDSTNHKYEDSFHLDFGELEGLSRIGEPPVSKIAKSVEGIQKDLSKLSRTLEKLGNLGNPRR